MSLSITEQLKNLEEQIKRQLGVNGLDEVADKVIDVAKKQVKETVYDAYEPVAPEKGGYERTYLLQNSWGVSLYSPLTIGVFSDRWDGSKYVSEVVETGKGYDITGNYPYEVPRPFVQNTIDELKKTKIHVDAYAKALRDVGYKVRIK